MTGTHKASINALDMAFGEFKKWALPHLATGTEPHAQVPIPTLNYDPKITENLGL